MLVLAILALPLTILTVWRRPVALQLIRRRRSPQGRGSTHTRILLSRQGTHAVVTCLRGAFFGFSGSGDMAVNVPVRVCDGCWDSGSIVGVALGMVLGVEITAVLEVHPGCVRSSHIDWGSRIHRLMGARWIWIWILSDERNLEGLGSFGLAPNIRLGGGGRVHWRPRMIRWMTFLRVKSDCLRFGVKTATQLYRLNNIRFIPASSSWKCA